MTTEEMRDAIEVVYADTVKGCGIYPAELPANVTPQSFYDVLPASVEALSPEEFREHAQRVGYSLGIQSIDAGVSMPDCNRFARLRVQDRPEVSVSSQGGRGIPRTRERQFIVHALGWTEGRT